MNEKPILFSAPMVRAILDGRKTQERRVVKFPEDWDQEHVYPNGDLGLKYGGLWDTVHRLSCPYGQPGDRLWVRETWLEWDSEDYSANPNDPMTFRYRADGEIPAVKWKSPYFMRRYASRITLEVVGVRVERLQDITDDDAKAEGAEEARKCEAHEFLKGVPLKKLGNHRAEVSGHGLSFMRLWDSINGKKYPWDSSPWVWVIEFKRLANKCG